MIALRNKIKNWANMCLGIKEGTEEHKMILGTYNGYALHHKLPQIKVTDSWCACFVSACFIASGYSSLIPCEISCERMINKAKIMGIWVELDSYIPAIGDIVAYDWQDNGVGDCKGWSDHVGIVTAVQGARIEVVEGNKSNKVDKRYINVDGKYIRGYICPRYTS